MKDKPDRLRLAFTMTRCSNLVIFPKMYLQAQSKTMNFTTECEVNQTDDEKIDENRFQKLRLPLFKFDVPVGEFLVYVGIWTVSIFYSLYVLHHELSGFVGGASDDMISDGFFGLRQDVSDMEWRAMLAVYKNGFYWYVAFVAVCQLRQRRLKTYSLTSLSVLYLNWLFGFRKFCFVVMPVYIVYLVHLLRRRRLCIFAGVALIVFYTSSLGLRLLDHLTDSDDEYLLVQGSICWVTCRAISFCADRSDKATDSISEDLIESMNYCLYFPSLLRGPFLPYDKFGLERRGFFKPFLLFFRYAVWFFVLVGFYHTFHVCAVVLFPEEIAKLSAWAICGLIFSSGMIFMLKCTVIYGFAQVVASVDGVDLPPPPRCIACMPLYSYFWRYFDPGMYMFIRLYLYLPLFQLRQNILLKVIGSLLCFTFVFFWHGMRWSIFVWTSLNFVGIILEMIGRRICKSKYYKDKSGSVSKSTLSRFKAVCVTPMYILSVLSTAFFLTGFRIGMICFDKIFVSGFPVVTVTIFLVFYCASHVGLVVLSWLNSRYS